MRIGAVFPQYDVLRDAADVAEFARGLEGLGMDHLLVYDHVLGVDPAVRPEWTHLYRNDSEFHEPFVLFGYLAAVCRLELEEFDGGGPAPRPRREIPVWLAGKAPAALARVGRIADGWFPLEKPGAEAAARLGAAREAGRDAAEIGVEPRIRVPARPADELAAERGFWIDHGASHLSFSTMDSGPGSVVEHLRHLESALSTVSLGG